MNYSQIIKMHSQATMEGLELPSHTVPQSPCEVCAIGKSTCKPFSKKSNTPRAERPGIFLHTDVCGPMSQLSMGGARYFILFKDDYSGVCFVFCIKGKSDVTKCFKLCIH